MPTSALDNPLTLAVLGLLAEGARHQYALLSDIRARYPFLQAKTASVYTLVESLRRRGLLTLATGSTSPTGPSGDERRLASVSDAGVVELRHQVEQHLSASDPSTDLRFLLALAYVAILPAECAAHVLEQRARELGADRDRLREVLATTPVREAHMMETHLLLSRLEHDSDWLSEQGSRIRHGSLTWPAPVHHEPASMSSEGRATTTP